MVVRVIPLITFLLVAMLLARAVVSNSDPFAFFRPSIIVTADDRKRLDRGESIARVMAADGREVAVFAAVAVNASGDRVLAWMRRIEELKKSPYVTQIGRFSDPPTLSDLDGLSLSEEDVEDARWCRPRRCSLKLAAPEMDALRRAAEQGRSDWREAVQQSFRRIVLARVQAYRTAGHASLPLYDDQNDRAPLQETFSSILRHSLFLNQQLPALSAFLERCPCPAPAPFESFLYWSKEQPGGKPAVMVTHVVMARGAAGDALDVVVAGKQVFATHYVNGSLGVTALFRDGDRHYLTYVNRSSIDLLRGFLSRLIRLIVERRLASEAPDILQGLKRRLEAGDPPAAVATPGKP